MNNLKKSLSKSKRNKTYIIKKANEKLYKVDLDYVKKNIMKLFHMHITIHIYWKIIKFLKIQY